MAKRKVTRKKIVRKNIADGIVHIAASFNNTMVTVTDNAGNAIAWSSAGNLGFKGSKKSTPFAAQAAVEDAMAKAMEHGIKNVGIKIQGNRIELKKNENHDSGKQNKELHRHFQESVHDQSHLAFPNRFPGQIASHL